MYLPMREREREREKACKTVSESVSKKEIKRDDDTQRDVESE